MPAKPSRRGKCWRGWRCRKAARRVQAPVAGQISNSSAVSARWLPARAKRCSPSSPAAIRSGRAGPTATSPSSGRPGGADQDHRRRRSRRPVRGWRRRSSPRPARPGLRHHHQPAAVGECVRPRADKTGQSCGVSVPLTAILYGTAGTVVQVVEREPRRDPAGGNRLDVAGQVEIREGIQEGLDQEGARRE